MRNLKTILVVAVVLCAAAVCPAKLRQVGMVDLTGQPGFNEVAMANGQVVISRPATNTIEIFSPVKRRVIARISQVDSPRGIAVDEDGSRVYVALSGSNSIAVINSHNWIVEKLVPVKSRPEKLLWVKETKTLYSASTFNRTISTIDPIAGRESGVIDLNALPEDLAYDSGRRQLFVSLQDVSEIAVIDRSNKIVNYFHVTASEPTGLALDSVRNRLYVAVRYAVVALNLDNGSEILRIPAPGGTDALILDPSGSLLYAAGGDGSVLAIDLNRNVVDHEMSTDVKGFSLAYDAAHRMLFMPGAREGRSKMVILSPAPANDQPRPQTAASPANPPVGDQTAMKK
jgi:YVTN family beta-propeller protein